MRTIFNPDTVPSNYEETVKKYTAQGLRVLALGSKPISQKESSLSREKLEQNLNFDGLEVFENRLKADTEEAVEELKEAAITMVTITGDNPFTACNIALKSGIADALKRMLIVDCSGSKLEVEYYQ